MVNMQHILAAGLIACSLSACKPSSPPPDLVKTQRDALNKAKAVEGQVQQQAQEQQKTIDEQQK